MRNTNSNQFSNNSGLNSMYSNNSTSIKTELSFSLINNKEFQEMIEELRIQENLSWDVETLIRNNKLITMMKDSVYELGEQQFDVISKYHNIDKTKNEYFNNCYRNSYRKMGEDIGYVEGLIINKSNPSGIIYHSWNINQDGEFIDYTLRNSSEYEYIGIVIPNEIVDQVVSSINVQEKRKAFIHLPIFPFLEFIEVEQKYSNRNHKRGGTVK